MREYHQGRPDYRRRELGQRRVKQQQRGGRARLERPFSAAQQSRHEGVYYGDMNTAYAQYVRSSIFLKALVNFFVHEAFVAEYHARQDTCGLGAHVLAQTFEQSVFQRGQAVQQASQRASLHALAGIAVHGYAVIVKRQNNPDIYRFQIHAVIEAIGVPSLRRQRNCPPHAHRGADKRHRIDILAADL